MTDAWADGWDNGSYAFADDAGNVVASGTLDDGAYGVDEVCLADGCYALTVAGSAFPSEVFFSGVFFFFFLRHTARVAGRVQPHGRRRDAGL